MLFLVVCFVVTLVLGVPVAFCLGLAGLLFILVIQKAPLITIPTLLFGGIDSFPLMAMPFFILAGFLAERSGILPKLVEFANSVVGHLRGGLAHVNIMASMLFAGVTGVAVADTAAIGSMLIPSMIKEGYDKKFTAVVTAASSVMGPIIPPSCAMIIVAFLSGGKVSVIGLFLAGVIPGITIGLSQMGIVYTLAKLRGYPIRGGKFSIINIVRKLKGAILGLMVPILIIGGILSGIFTPTEAGAVAVGYVLFVGTLVTRRLNFRNIAECLLQTSVTSSVIFLLLATAKLISFLLVSHQVPQKAANMLMSITGNPTLFLIMCLIFLLLIGFFLEAVATMIMLVPILMPIAITYGIEPHHFGLLFVMTVQIALITPPVALGLFIVCELAHCKIEDVFKEIWPFIFVTFAVIILVAIFPNITMWLPKIFGYAQ
jgi:tripartite ATP-independent transporter DctM subunit